MNPQLNSGMIERHHPIMSDGAQCRLSPISLSSFCYPITGLALSPMIAAAEMSLSSVLVISNVL